MPTLSALFSTAVKILKEEKTIFMPFFIFFLLLHSAMNILTPSLANTSGLTPELILFIGIGWVLELFFKCLTISFTLESLDNKLNNLTLPLNRVLTHFLHILFATAILVAPLLFFGNLIINQAESLSFSFISVLFGILLMLFMVIILHLLPVIILLDQLNWYQGLLKATLLIRHRFREILFFCMSIFLILFMILLSSAMLNPIPVIGDSLMQVLVKGVGYSLVYVITTVFYIGLSKDIASDPKE